MKRFILTVVSVACMMFVMLNSVQAQKGNISKAQKWAESGEQLDDALSAVEFAEKHPKTMNWVKTYYIKGLVYLAISNSDNPEYQSLCKDPLEVAFNSFKKAYTMEGSEDYYQDIDNRIVSISDSYYTKGMVSFEIGDDKAAFSYFTKSLKIKEMTGFKGKLDPIFYLTTAMVAQKINKYEEAIGYYNKLNKYNYKDGVAYIYLASCYKALGETENYLKQLKIGYEKYPENMDFIDYIIDYYLTEGDNSEEAYEYINIAKQKYPTNAQYILAEALLNTKIEQPEKAKELYLKLIELRPNLFAAHYNLGVIYFNEAQSILDEAKTLTDNKKFEAAKELADAKFAEALPFFETAHKLSKENRETMSVLREIYQNLDMNEKYIEIVEKLTEDWEE